MSKVNCEAVGKRRQASLRMARAELLHLLQLFVKNLFLCIDRQAQNRYYNLVCVHQIRPCPALMQHETTNI